MKKILFIAGILLACGLSLPALAATVTASLDRDQITSGETVQLSLQHEGRGGGDPDLSPLNKDFDILERNSSSGFQLANGDLSSQRMVRLTLAPKHTGKLQVPSLSWDGQQTAALTLTVSDQASEDQTGTVGASAPHVFLTTTLDQDKPYVQAAVVLTVRLHTDKRFYQASLDLPASNDVLVQQLPGQDHQTTETRNGHSYEVIERQYLLQPQRSGAISLDGPVLDAQVFDASNGGPFGAMMQTTRPLRLHGDAIKLDVRPRPAAASGHDWLPARQVTLEEAWRPDGAEVHVGEPITLHLRLRARGLTAAQLPDLAASLSLPEGIKAYPDQPKLDNGLQNGEVVGTREQDIALIASRPGRYQLPALHLSWWDTAQDAQREAVMPEHTLEILPAAGGEPAPAAPASAAPPSGAAVPPAPATSADLSQAPSLSARPALQSWWPWLSLALGLLWLGTLAAWWFQRRNAKRDPMPVGNSVPESTNLNAGPARKAFQQACGADDAQSARKHLLDWVRATWPDERVTGLNALAQRLGDPTLGGLLRELDRACYAGGAWRGAELAAALTSLPKASAQGTAVRKLADLYP